MSVRLKLGHQVNTNFFAFTISFVMSILSLGTRTEEETVKFYKGSSLPKDVRRRISFFFWDEELRLKSEGMFGSLLPLSFPSKTTHDQQMYDLLRDQSCSKGMFLCA